MVKIEIFDAVRIVHSERTTDITANLPGSVLRILALRVGSIVSTDQLVAGIYAGARPSTASAQLQAHISRLRQLLGSSCSVLETVGLGYRLCDLPDLATIDVVEFRQLCEGGLAAGRGGAFESAAHQLRAAVGKWGDLALPDHLAAGTDTCVNRLHHLRTLGLEMLTEVEAMLGLPPQAIPDLAAAVLSSPSDERLRRALILAQYRSGQQVLALQEYESLRHTLSTELGLDPAPNLQRLQQQILQHDPNLLARPLQQAVDVGGRHGA